MTIDVTRTIGAEPDEVCFEVTEMEATESERRWRWRVAGIRATGHRVIRRADGRTRLIFEALGLNQAQFLKS